MEDENPLIQHQLAVYTYLGDKSLDYHALSNAFNTAVNPGMQLAKKRLLSRKVSNAEILLNPGKKFVVVSPSDHSKRPYRVRDSGDDAEGDASYACFHDNDTKMEYTNRHPGTSVDSDVEDGVDPDERYPFYRMNEQSSPITTTSGEHLYCIAFAGPGGIVSELRAAYALQLSARIDEARKCLALDCFEHKPVCFDAKSISDDDLPTYREVKRWEDSVMQTRQSRSMWDDEESDTDDEDPQLDEQVEPKEGKSFDENARLLLMYQGATGNFLQSRCLRVRISLLDIAGIRLQAARLQKGSEGDEDVGAVLILEVKCHPKANAFAARKILAKYHNENDFALIEDWTPNKVASRSTRCYLYGNLIEMKQTAALMAKLCPHIAEMLASKTAGANTLRDSVSAEYAAAPNFAEPDVDMEDAKPDARVEKKASKYKMSVADVHALLFEKKLVDEKGEVPDVNPCLKRAILLGHIEVDECTTKDTIIYRGSCVHCDDTLCCTIGDALYQSTYGGGDYCDGGEGAGVKCESCSDEDGDGGGNYITGLCRGDFSFDSGKFHNHCTECDDFGICIGDYREGHCAHCNNHYFVGNSGFPCPSCGGGKSKPLKNMDPPPLSAWDGKAENAMEVFEAQCASVGAMQGAMMKAMVLGPEAAISGSGDTNSSHFASMVTQMASQMMDTDGDEKSEVDGAPEECRQM